MSAVSIFPVVCDGRPILFPVTLRFSAIIPLNRTRCGMTNDYGDSDFANPTAVCDVIMKGGITSGVVYPLALTELARQFRFSQVGGTSAGAIAAAAAAAAEYGRHAPGGGFARLAKLPAEVGQILFSLFQPTPALKPVFDILVAAIGNDSMGM